MDILFNEEVYAKLTSSRINNPKENILSPKGKEIWNKACYISNLNYCNERQNYNNLFQGRYINCKRSSKTNLHIFLALGTVIPRETIRDKLRNGNWEIDTLNKIDNLFLPNIPVYIDLDAFKDFLNYSSRLFVKENDKIILYSIIRNRSFSRENPLTVNQVLAEIRKRSPKVGKELGEEELLKSISRLKDKDYIVRINKHTFYLNVNNLTTKYNTWRNYPVEV